MEQEKSAVVESGKQLPDRVLGCSLVLQLLLQRFLCRVFSVPWRNSMRVLLCTLPALLVLAAGHQLRHPALHFGMALTCGPSGQHF